MDRNIRKIILERPLVFDGAMGTMILRSSLNIDDYRGHANCHEYLVISRPDVISGIHASYFQAGADIVETNSFGANAVTLAEHGLSEEAYRLNKAAAAIARRVADSFAADDNRPRFVSGSIGPGSKLPSLQHIGFDELVSAYREQAAGLIDGGADVLQVETCQDVLQIKAALAGIRLAKADRDKDTPVIVQATIERNNHMLLGTDIMAALSAFAPLDIFAFGMNCGTGPENMYEHLKVLSEKSPHFISVLPNAGLPEMKDGKLVYSLGPDDFAAHAADFVRRFGVRLVGGCCGTTPEHIKALANAVKNITVSLVNIPARMPSCSSLFVSQELDISPKPLIIGEKTNANGSKKFRDALLADDIDAMLEVALEQQNEGAHLIDLSIAYAGRNEAADMAKVAARINREIRLPLCIDSTNPEAVEAALKNYGGRALINSINLEDGGAKAKKILELAVNYGAAVIALTIDETGMAKTKEHKLAVAKRLCDLAKSCGLERHDLFIDCLTFTLGSGDAELKNAGIETLDAIELIKCELPGVFTLLGVSNISYGLSPASRKIINAVFLYHAVQRGLDAAIFHAGKIVPIASINQAQLELAENLIFNRVGVNGKDPLEAIIEYYQGKTDTDESPVADTRPIDERLISCVVNGRKALLEDLLKEALEKYSASDIINKILLAGMQKVGVFFGEGKMQLPFVLKSAEVMKKAVLWLKPHLVKGEVGARGSMVLATVKGDVHDIGKNLVDIILASNGFTVHNIGTDQSAGQILEAVRLHNPDCIGLSGLLVRSCHEMKEILTTLSDNNINVPVICGGAALTKNFVASELVPAYRGAVRYAKDAFDAVRMMGE